jgi:type IV pilus assembly protein PilM
VARTTIGLDIGSSAVRAAELAHTRTGTSLVRLGQVVLPEGAVRDGEVIDVPAVAAALKQLWKSTGFSHKKVVLGIANRRVLVRDVEVPDMPAADLRKALPFQVQNVLPMPVEQALMDFHPLERATSPAGVPLLRGMLVAAWRDAVETSVAAVQAAGLDPVSVDLSPFAVLRSMGSGLESEVGTEVLVEIGRNVTTVVVHSTGVPRFVRILLRGGQDITEALAERAGVSLGEAEQLKRDLGLGADGAQTVVGHAVEAATRSFVDEVRSSIDYYAASNPDHRAEAVVLSGGGALLRGLDGRVAVATGIPTRVGSAVRRVQPGRGAPEGDALFALAPMAAVPVGLALGATS